MSGLFYFWELVGVSGGTSIIGKARPRKCTSDHVNPVIDQLSRETAIARGNLARTEMVRMSRRQRLLDHEPVETAELFGLLHKIQRPLENDRDLDPLLAR